MVTLNDFDAVRQTVQDSQAVTDIALDDLASYWDDRMHGFFTNPSRRGSVNITSTCFAAYALNLVPEALKKIRIDGAVPTSRDFIHKVICRLLRSKWTSEDLPENNIYTAPIAIATVLYYESQFRECGEFSETCKTYREKILSATDAILKETRVGYAAFENYEPSAYLTYWCYWALRLVTGWSCAPGKLCKEATSVLADLKTWSFHETNHQLALHASGDVTGFDPIQLSYALTLYSRAANADGETVNERVIATAIDTIFKEQEVDGLWRKTHPIFSFRTIGSVYPFSFESIDTLTGLDRAPYCQMLWRNWHALAKSMRWALENHCTSGDYSGWRSNDLPVGGPPNAWSTAAVGIAAFRVCRLLRAFLRDERLKEFRATRPIRASEDALGPHRLYDSDVTLDGVVHSLSDVLTQKLIIPHVEKSSTKKKLYSAVLFGPPGTAKTTLAELIAERLGWPYVYLQTSDFSTQGLSRVTGRAREVFGGLGDMDNTVLLFDEVEEFVRDRDNKNINPESYLITTAMLSLIQELRKRRGPILLVATNFLNKFDKAITRAGGRFDMLLQIGPPSKSEKLRIFRDRVYQYSRSDSDELERLCMDFNEAANEVDSVDYFIYAEWDSLARHVIEAFDEGMLADTKDDIKRIIQERSSTLTIRGKLKKRYVKSKSLSVIHA